jgi:uncharacterized RDD family membrane protein YckC
MGDGDRRRPALEPTILANPSATPAPAGRSFGVPSPLPRPPIPPAGAPPIPPTAAPRGPAAAGPGGAPPTTPDGAPAGDGDPLLGTRLKHFEILTLLGRGGMGSVYLGNDTALERPVALKILSPEVAHDPEVVARFVREARAQARLRHPNVAQIYFIGEDRGLHFFVMEYLPGPSLEELLRTERKISWPQALEYVIAAARGLRAAAAEGFIHRDVKPSNLMLDREAGIKILDFGLVKSMHGDTELTREGTIIGSPLYMSPEQGRGDPVDQRSDIYSLGCALYHMLTGQPPFTGASPVGVIAMHLTQRPPSTRTLTPELPEPVQRLVEGMMAKEPAARFASYDELVAAAEAARPGQRELTAVRRRALALAIDGVALAPFAYLLGPWVALVLAAYFVVCHRLAGQTLGKWLVGLEVTDRAGKRLSWRAAALRFAAFVWGPLVWGLLAAIAYFVHRDERIVLQLDRVSLRQLVVPIVYGATATGVLVAYLAGFMLAAFHPRRLALHDVMVGTDVRAKGGRQVEQVARVIKATTRLRLPTFGGKR